MALYIGSVKVTPVTDTGGSLYLGSVKICTVAKTEDLQPQEEETEE